MEKWLDGHGLAALHMAGLATDRLQNPVQLAVDLRVQHALRDELLAAHTKFKTLAAAGLVLDVRTGEIVAMVSEPDYDPNNPREALDPTRINRLTTGVFEMGSTFKAFTIAMALDSGKFTLKSSFDAHGPMHVGRFQIHDFEPENRMLTIPEIFTYSSNIGAARTALAMGVDAHKAFLKKTGSARSAAHGIAGERRADRAAPLGRTQHHHHRLRSRSFGGAAAGFDGSGGDDERRLSDPADISQAQRRGSAVTRQTASSSLRLAK